MAAHRLLQRFANTDPVQLAQVFGREYTLRTPGSTAELAPVKRVALFAESFLPKIDGVSKSAFLTLSYLQQTGREVLVFAPNTSPPSIGPSQIVRVPSLGLPFAPETRVALPTLSIASHLEAFQPDLIHMFSPAMLSVGGMLAGRRRDIPVLANYQTDLPAYTQHYGFGVLKSPMRHWLRYIHNGCHLTLVPSEHTRRELSDSGYRRLRIWRRGVDGERFNPQHRSAAWRERLLNGRDPKSLLCIYVGRLATEKRIDLLLEVARTPGVALTLVGDGAAREELENLFAGTNTCFTGYLVGNDLAYAYASADVFLFPSPSETFGQVVQEAMASGLPTLVINRGGVADLVADGTSGMICEEDPQAFAAAVRILRDDPALRTRMAHSARQLAEQYPWERIMAQLEEYYIEAFQMNERYNRLRRISLQRPFSQPQGTRYLQ